MKKNACAIPRVSFAAAGATMQKVYGNFKCLFNEFMRSVAFNVDDKTNTARIMLEFGIVQSR